MADDDREIRAFVDEWMAASKGGDLTRLLAMMTDDAVFMTPGREPFGKERFAEGARAMKDVHIDGSADIEEIVVTGDWAWYRTHLVVTMTPPGGPAMRRSGYALTILRKEHGRWRLARDANLLPSP